MKMGSDVFILVICLQVFGCGAFKAIMREQYNSVSYVSEYENYGSISLFRFLLPESVFEANLSFMLNKTGACPDRDIYISIHRDGLPIVNPYNTSFPDSTEIKHASGYNFTFNTTSTQILPSVTIYGPEPGNWFIVAYRLKEDVDKIDQKGLGKDCRYLMQPTLVYSHVLDIPLLSELSRNEYKFPESQGYALFRYQTKLTSSLVKFKVSQCSGMLQNKSLVGNCPLNISWGERSIPVEGNPISCSNEGDECQVVVNGVLRNVWYYLKVEKAISEKIEDFSFNIMVEEEDCSNIHKTDMYGTQEVEMWEEFSKVLYSGLPIVSFHNTSMMSPFEDISEDNLEDTSCAPFYHLVSVKTSSSSSKKFVKVAENNTDVYPVQSQKPIVMTFDLDPIEDFGGLLVVEVNASKLPNPYIQFCLQQMGPAIKDNVNFNCDSENVIQSNLSMSKRERWTMPFPVIGTLYLTLQVDCSQESDNSTDCGEDAEIIVNLSLDQQCIGSCGKNGQCSIRYRSGIQFFYCRCFYGYQGFACTDDSEAWTRAYYLARVLFLTLSNIVFLVATIFAIYRYHFAESVSYIATTIFSTLYHACDSSRVCVMDYDTLQFCDFYSSFMSVLLTLIAMAKLNPTLKATVHMIGAFFVAFAAKYDRFSLWAILVPLSAGLGVVLVSWGYKMYQRKELYPSKKRWLLFILPGTVLALIGLIFTAALETEENYFITHSIWHICIGLSALFLLPPKPTQLKRHASERELLDVNSISTQNADGLEPYSFMTGE